METKPYTPPSPPIDELPMRWADGSTVRAGQMLPPPPPAFGTVLPAPPYRGRSALRGALVGGAIGGVVLVALVLAVRPDGALAPNSPPPVAAGVGVVAQAAARNPASASSDLADAPPSPCPTRMALVPGGNFFMGTDADEPVLQTARPAHPAEVTSFCMDLSEVSLGDYRQCSTKGECKRAFRESRWPQGQTPKADWEAQMAAHSELCNEPREDRDSHPVNCVDWQQAKQYCEWRGGALPSEAQWEFAARGSDGRVYSWGDALPTRAHMNGSGPEYVAWREARGLPAHATLYDEDDGFVGTAPTGRSTAGATEHGLLDMAGNVFEWTADEYRPYADERADVPGPARRVIRGGAFNSFQPQFADPALRFPQTEDAHTHGIGFRCVTTPRDSAPSPTK